jgi:tRNA(adenine34) deaminase
LTLINQVAFETSNLKLDEYTLYVTLEPCAMCYSAAKQANIKKIYYLLDNQKNHDTKLLTLHDQKINLATFGTKKMQEHYRKIINKFFISQRAIF